MSKGPDQPDYYGGGKTHEFINCLEAWGMRDNAYRFQAIVYMARAGRKPDVDELRDLKAAKYYLEREIAYIEKMREVEEVVGRVQKKMNEFSRKINKGE